MGATIRAKPAATSRDTERAEVRVVHFGVRQDTLTFATFLLASAVGACCHVLAIFRLLPLTHCRLYPQVKMNSNPSPSEAYPWRIGMCLFWTQGTGEMQSLDPMKLRFATQVPESNSEILQS